MRKDLVKAMKARKLAKEFRDRIPYNMALKLPDDIGINLKILK